MGCSPALFKAIKPQEHRFNTKMETSIKIKDQYSTFKLNAYVFRPHKSVVPKTVVIIVPGSGNVSRNGEVSGDGIDSYDSPKDMSLYWARALSDRGYFVLSYDKRTCNSNVNALCNNVDQKNVNEKGIYALAQDVDSVYNFVKNKLGESARIFFLSSTQGAQAISLSTSIKKVNGTILLSPIMGDLQKMWTKGLKRAAITKSGAKKNNLLNRKENIDAFFNSLKNGHFPEQSNIKGASVAFWQTWMEASDNTLNSIFNSNKPALLMFSEKDYFFSHELVKDIKKPVRLEIIKGSDRNFMTKNYAHYGALDTVEEFIKKVN